MISRKDFHGGHISETLYRAAKRELAENTRQTVKVDHTSFKDVACVDINTTHLHRAYIVALNNVHCGTFYKVDLNSLTLAERGVRHMSRYNLANLRNEFRSTGHISHDQKYYKRKHDSMPQLLNVKFSDRLVKSLEAAFQQNLL